MNQADAIDIVQQAIWTVVLASGPAVAAAMAVGIIIALLQALTQVQEMTLTFIPKIIATFLVGAAVAHYGTLGTPVAFTSIAFLLGLFLLPMGEETTGKTLPA